MFIIKISTKGKKVLIINSYNNTFQIGIITILRNILKYT
jgi:hypothetical protein